jgi:rhodanese-related sulfurtransferase
VARQLQADGFNVAVLDGGLDAWRAGHAVEPLSGAS